MRLGYREIYTWFVSLAVLFYEILDLETQPPRACGLRAAEGRVPASCWACGKGLGPRPPSSKPREGSRASGRESRDHFSLPITRVGTVFGEGAT